MLEAKAAAGLCVAGKSIIADRVKGALYGLLIADAMAMPTHWYYGGESQVRRAYGGPINGYVAPQVKLPGSIMSKSNTGGGGRGSYKGDIIGTHIFHGKKKYWAPGADYHYHHALKAGDNTLEGLLTRRVMNVTAACNGVFDADAIRSDYIEFMQTPGSHNDTYAGTCHRMFFGNLADGTDPKDCPDNDNHNVDTADSLVATVPVALLSASDEEADRDVAATVAVTRRSPESEKYAQIYSRLLRKVVMGAGLKESLQETAKLLRMRLPETGSDPVTA